MQQMLLMLVGTSLPILALIFVTALFAHKLYINVRSRYDIKVNCWFCNDNTRVSYAERNSWTCPHCEQYNGFNKDGDYNRDLNSSRGSHNSSMASPTICANAYYTNELNATPPAPSNGLCDQCNEAQRLKVEKLAQFEPKHESRYEHELKIYQKQLEQQFRLCGSCERHVNKVLHEKKKMVLGSKFLNFIIKGAALLKQPHFNRLARVQQQRRLQRYQRLMILLTILNVLCLLCSLPPATRTQFAQLLGETAGHAIFFVYSHALTLLRVLADYAGGVIAEQRLIARFLLFGSTITKLLLYSLGLTQAQAQQATFNSCYTSLYPYAMLALCFLHNIRDGLKFTRITLLLVLWSIYAKGSMLLFEAIDGVTFLLLGSLITLILLTTNRGNSLLTLAHNESVGDSFHRLYADECISDDETISMLSQQLSCNNSMSNSMNGSQQLRQRSQSHIAPSVLSLDSLHLSSHRNAAPTQLASPVPSYRTASTLGYAASCVDAQQSWRNMNNMNMSPSYGWQRGIERRPAASTLCNGRHQTRNLLLPSRLQQQHDNHITAWVNANNGRQWQQQQQQHQQFNLLEEPSTANLLGFTCSDDKQQLSRTSSQSSGFESQLGQQNPARAEPQLFVPHIQPQHPQQLQLQQQQHQPARVPNAGGYLDVQMCTPEASSLSLSQRQLRVAAPLPSPYSTQSEIHFDRPLPPQANPDIRPGDLLRKWLSHNVGAKQKSNG